MDILSNKAILISAGILISIAIMTAVLVTVNQVKKAYGLVNNADVSALKEFDDIIIEYSGTEMNGTDLVNTVKRFENNGYITIEYDNKGIVIAAITLVGAPIKREAEFLNKKMQEDSTDFKYETKYNVTAVYTANNTKILIKFTKI